MAFLRAKEDESERTHGGRVCQGILCAWRRQTFTFVPTKDLHTLIDLCTPCLNCSTSQPRHQQYVLSYSVLSTAPWWKEVGRNVTGARGVFHSHWLPPPVSRLHTVYSSTLSRQLIGIYYLDPDSDPRVSQPTSFHRSTVRHAVSTPPLIPYIWQPCSAA